MTTVEQHQYAALLLRVSLGAMYIAHGLLKITVFTLPGTAAFFSSFGFPGWLAYPVAILEIAGGVLLVAGIATRTIALAFVPILLGALYVHWSNGWLFTSEGGGWEYVAFLIVSSAALALLGDGAYTARALIHRESQPVRS